MALDPGVFESPNSEIQTQFSSENYQVFHSNVRVSSVGGKAGAQGSSNLMQGPLIYSNSKCYLHLSKCFQFWKNEVHACMGV